MVGSDMSVAGANIVLNTAVAEELRKIADKLEEVGAENLEKVLKEIFVKHGRIIFNGNNYSEEWKKEAEKRGLCNMPTTVDAIPAYIEPKNIELFASHGVMTETEMRSRYENINRTLRQNRGYRSPHHAANRKASDSARRHRVSERSPERTVA